MLLFFLLKKLTNLYYYDKITYKIKVKMKKLKLYLVDDDIFKKIQSFSEEAENLSIKEYQSLLKGSKEVSTEFETAGHALLENLLYVSYSDYSSESKNTVKPIEFLCGEGCADVLENDEDGFAYLSNQKISDGHIEFINQFNFDETVRKNGGIEKITDEWNHIFEKEIYKSEDFSTGKNLLNAIKEAFNLSFENKMNIVWAYLGTN